MLSPPSHTDLVCSLPSPRLPSLVSSVKDISGRPPSPVALGPCSITLFIGFQGLLLNWLCSQSTCILALSHPHHTHIQTCLPFFQTLALTFLRSFLPSMSLPLSFLFLLSLLPSSLISNTTYLDLLSVVEQPLSSRSVCILLDVPRKSRTGTLDSV